MREVEIRYRRSFLSRYIQAEPYIQDYYTEIKNELLSYRGVKARTSWSKESFNRGRTHIARMDVKGKALYLYLALAPESLDPKYRVAVAKGDCPTLIKIKSERKKKYALELIRMLMESLELKRIEREAEDYHLPYEDNDALIERGLIKVILPKGESLDENAIAVKADLSGIESHQKQKNEASDAVEGIITTEEKVEKEAFEKSEITEKVEDEIREVVENKKNVENDVVEEPVPEAVVLEAENEIRLEARLDDIIKSCIDGRSTRVLTSPLFTPVVSRSAKKTETVGFAFRDTDVKNALFTLPYTREEYLALPRKKKKSVLMSVKALLRYAATKRAIDLLRSYKSESERTAERIATLEARLKDERRILPTAPLWADAVKRVVK